MYYTLLSQGVLIAEHVTSLAPLSGRCTEIMFLGLNIAGSDGAAGACHRPRYRLIGGRRKHS